MIKSSIRLQEYFISPNVWQIAVQALFALNMSELFPSQLKLIVDLCSLVWEYIKYKNYATLNYVRLKNIVFQHRILVSLINFPFKAIPSKNIFEIGLKQTCLEICKDTNITCV